MTSLSSRKRPHSVRYRRLLLAIAAAFDRRAQAIRAHVKAHTPHRHRVLIHTGNSAGYAAGCVDPGQQAAARTDPAQLARDQIATLDCTCPPESRPTPCEHEYSLTDCWQAAHDRHHVNVGSGG